MSFLADGKKLPFSRSKKRPREPEDSDVEESESSNSSGNSINEAPIENREGGGRKFSKTRITVLSFLVIVGTVCGAMTYEFTSSAEHDIYKEQVRCVCVCVCSHLGKTHPSKKKINRIILTCCCCLSFSFYFFYFALPVSSICL